MNKQVGRYRVLGKLGKGAMGVVYLAEDPVLNRQVAIKTVELAGDDPRRRDFLRDRLIRDGRAAAGLSHPNIVSVYDVLDEGDCGYLVMEYIAGESLAARLGRTPQPDMAFIARVLREMASALDYTHARGIIHRDIKPANVMLDAFGAAKIMDFGIARISSTQTNTPAGTVMGTLEYMAPEQIKGEPVDGRADQFSLAAVAYELLTGSTMFGEQTFATLAYKIVNEMPPPLRTHNPKLPSGVDEVVSRALRKAPEDRFPTCGEFAMAVERAIAGEVPGSGQPTLEMQLLPPSVPTVATARPVVAQVPAAPPPAPVAPPSKGRGVLIGVAGVLAAAVLGGGLLLWKPWANTVNLVAERPPTPGQASEAPPVTPPVHPVVPKPKPSSAVSEGTKSDAAKEPPQPPQATTPSAAGKETARSTPVAPPESNDTPPVSPPEADPADASVPRPALAALREGEALVKADRYPQAIQEFTKAIELRPEFNRAYFARGAAYLHMNRPAEALADYSEILMRNPRSPNAISQRGICHSRLKDEDAAMADFNRALELRPGIPGALNGRGLIYLHRKQYQKAVHEFTEAIRVAPEFGWAYLNRAHAEEALGAQAAAQADTKRAKELGR
jgi:serine/threonine-protein kinase